MIEIQHLSKQFGPLAVLRDVNLTLPKGECVALIGPNGCGKTTLIKTILGMVLPTAGDVHFDGRSIHADINYRARIGYMPQIGRYPANMTIGQLIQMVKGIRQHTAELDEWLYRQFDLPNLLHKPLGTLSGGTTQKVSATLAFLFQPEVLILDEPTAGLDPLAAEILKDKIVEEKHKGKLILITSHLLSELDDLVTRLVFMQEGQVLLHQSMAELKETTGSSTIAKAITYLLKNQAA